MGLESSQLDKAIGEIRQFVVLQRMVWLLTVCRVIIAMFHFIFL